MEGEIVTVAAASRSYPGEAISGDLWVVDWHENRCRIAVIDGLGHGPEAAAAAQAAKAALAAHPDLSPTDAIRICHRALAGTRGAAITIVQIAPIEGRLTYAGVGNVEARLWQAGKEQRLVAYRGIVGSILPTLRSFDLALDGHWLLLVYTDGINSRFDLNDLTASGDIEPQALADTVLARWGRPMDDATVVVARPGYAHAAEAAESS